MNEPYATYTYETVIAKCRCPRCDNKHQRRIFPECHKRYKLKIGQVESDRRYVVECFSCEMSAIRTWNEQVKAMKAKKRRRRCLSGE